VRIRRDQDIRRKRQAVHQASQRSGARSSRTSQRLKITRSTARKHQFPHHAGPFVTVIACRLRFARHPLTELVRWAIQLPSETPTSPVTGSGVNVALRRR
jgi:hypothetical protein